MPLFCTGTALPYVIPLFNLYDPADSCSSSYSYTAFCSESKYTLLSWCKESRFALLSSISLIIAVGDFLDVQRIQV
jgi:hypothetical protein